MGQSPWTTDAVAPQPVELARDGGHRLVARSAEDPSKKGPLCSAPLFDIRKDARQTELDWEQTCHVVLQPRSCSSPWFGRRVPMQSSQAC
jgi:hypothetical protein